MRVGCFTRAIPREGMSRPVFFFAALVLSGIASIGAASGNGGASVPVLLELFTSEGCSSCPPADGFLAYLDANQPVAGADLIVMGEHVDYWDSSKWKDRFSSSQFSDRQQEYTSKYHLNGVYTPQLVVDGTFGFTGSDVNMASSAIARAMREAKIPIAISNVVRNGDQITARIDWSESGGETKGRPGVLFVAIADSSRESQVAGGENRGRSLSHVAVTRVLKRAGVVDLDRASARDITLVIHPSVGANGLRLIAFVQDPKSGHILGVAARKL